MSAQAMNALMEKEKKRFAGAELAGKTLGVVGLGAIGSLVARLGLNFGMEVVGFDPALSVEAAWRLPSEVQRMENVQSLFTRSDFVSLHLPVLDSTRGLINAEMLGHFRKGSCLLNFAREEIVSTESIVAALDAGQLRCYVADFPSPLLMGRSDALLMPHIGASTAEAEENCAIMAANQLKSMQTDHGDRRGEAQSIGKGHSGAGRAQPTGPNIDKYTAHVGHRLASLIQSRLHMGLHIAQAHQSGIPRAVEDQPVALSQTNSHLTGRILQQKRYHSHSREHLC